VGNLTVTVSNITHAFPNDVQMLVQGPSGRKTLLMAGAGGAHSLTNVTLTFDDSAETTLPASAEIITGTFKPTDFVSVTFPSPAPVGPYGTSLAAFDGTNPNGTWSLFVFDNSPGDSGNIAGGWSLNITSINPIDNPFESTLKAVSYSNGTLGFTLNGQPGHIYVIQASTDLINWSPIGTNTISGSGTFQFTDGNAGSFPYRYYRAALIGP
jgi:subtilisin-like proprotein convertase family protein